MASNTTSSVDKLAKSSIRYLSYRPRSKQEIKDYLSRKYTQDDQPQVIDQVINRLEDFNLLNDEYFASEWAQSRLNKGKGPIIIRLELKKKGIDEATISQTLSDIDPEIIQQSAANQLQKYHPKLKGLNPYQQKAKAYKYLYSRGFESKTIKAVIDASTIIKVK